jgi:hypothetical protein
LLFSFLQTLADDLAFDLGVALIESCKNADQRSGNSITLPISITVIDLGIALVEACQTGIDIFC